MPNNTLMFQVAIKKANEEYEKIKSDIDKLAKLADKGIDIKLKLDGVSNLQTFVNSLSALGGNSSAVKDLSEKVSNLKNELKEVGKSSQKSPDVMVRSFNVAKHEVERLGNTLVNAQRTIEKFGGGFFDTARLERYKMMLIEVRDNLKLISENDGIHPKTGFTAGQYLSSEDVSRVVSLMNTELGLYKSIGNELEHIVELRNKLSATLSANPNSAYAGGLQAAIAGLDLRQGLAGRLGVRDGLESLNTEAFRFQISEAIDLIRKVNAESRQTARDSKQAQTENEKWAASMNTAAIAATNLGIKIRELEQVRDRGKSANVDVTALEQQLTKMKDMLTILSSMEAGMKIHGFAGDYVKSAPYQNTLTMADAEARAINKNATEKERAARSTIQLTSEEQRLSQALNQTSESAKGQSQVLADLKSLATQYLGVWGAQQFVQNIIQIGGQLEQQRLSIGAILGDMSAGKQLFEQIKGLALTSPFGVMELDKDTKQLSAYGFKQNELYDMTKRLADISAGAGTEVSRLALALGHVRSEGALTGYTLRQFAMNNIPMLQKLSDRLSEIEGRIVSTSEIRKRVSKKEIGYEDVIAVIKDLTDEGGMFYNLQETMSEAVNAKFKNLKDSMDIMYGEMAEGKIGGLLKLIASSLMSLTRNWESSLRVIGAVTAAYLLYKNAVAGANKILTTSGTTTNLLTMRLNANRIALGLNSKSVKNLTDAEIDQMVRTKMLTKEQLLNAVASKRLSVTQAELAAATFNVSHAELVAIRNGGKMGLMWQGLKLQATSLKVTLLGVGSALKTMLLNPATIAFAVISAGLEVFMRWKQKNEEIAESIEQMANKGSEGYKNLSETLRKYSKDTISGGYETAISDIVDALKNYAPNVNSILEEAQAIGDLGDRYKYLRGELESTKKAYADLQQVSGVAINANESTGSWLFDDTFSKNVEQYVKDLQKVSKRESEFYHHRASIEEALNKVALNPKTAAFGKARRNEDGSLKTTEEQMEIIRKNIYYLGAFSTILSTVDGSARAAFQSYYEALGNADGRMKNEVLPDLKSFADKIDNDYARKFGDDWKKNAEHVKSAWIEILGVIDAVPGMTNKLRQELFEDIFNKHWGLDIKVGFTTDEIEEKLPAWMEVLQKELDGTGIILKADMSLEQIIDTVKKAYDTSQATINKLGPLVMKAGISLSAVSAIDAESYRLSDPLTYTALKLLQKAMSDNKIETTFGTTHGLNFANMKKDGSLKNTNKKKEDTELKKWREEFNELKAFYQEYKRWLSILKDEQAALDKIQEQGLFGPLFGKDGKPIYNISQWDASIDTFLEKIKGGSTDRDKFKTEVKKEKSSALADRLKEEVDNAAKEMEEYITKNADKFNLYKKILEQAGNKKTAELALSDGMIWDSVSRDFDAKLKEKTGFSSIDYSMSEKSAEKLFGKNAAAYALWKKIVEITRNNYVNALEKASSAEADILTNAQKIENLKQRIKDLQAETSSGIDHSSEIAQMTEEISKLSAEAFEYLPIYEEIFGDRAYKSWGDIKKAEDAAHELIDNSKAGAKDPKTGKTSYYTSYYMNNGEMEKVTLTRQQLERLKKTIDDFHKDEAKKNPFKTLFEDVEALYDELTDGDHDVDAANKEWLKFGESLAEVAGIVGNFAGQMSSMFDALGNESMAEAMADVQAGMNSVSNIAKGFAQGGVVGGVIAVAGEAVNWIGRLAQKHDKKLDKAIQKSQQEVKKLENEYKNLYGEIERRLTGIYGGNEYSTLLQNYKQQLSELESQRENESRKKKKDEDKLLDYDQQIKEMKDNIKYFAEDMAKNLYGIDVKSWAKELTDAVVDAWSKGEDAAKAWHDKVRDLVKDVTKNILSQKVVEAALKPVLDMITGEMYDRNGKLNEGSISKIAWALDEAGEQSVSGLTSLLEQIKAAGYDLSEGSSSSSTSSGIKSITENTADLLASYINAIRADVSENRMLLSEEVGNTSVLPGMSLTAKAQLEQLQLIADNTGKTAANTAMISEIYAILHANVLGANYFRVK